VLQEAAVLAVCAVKPVGLVVVGNGLNGRRFDEIILNEKYLA
jgi:hypothetical protein